MRRLEAATSMVLLLMSILTVQKGVLGTMITNLAANVKMDSLETDTLVQVTNHLLNSLAYSHCDILITFSYPSKFFNHQIFQL